MFGDRVASGTPLFSGLLSGIIGGIVVGAVSGSHTSVSGPAAGLRAIVASQVASLGSFETFLLAVFIAGLLQIGLGVMKAGAISAFIPITVINGLLTAIGVILILKQIPHFLGHDSDPEGEMSFHQPDHKNTFTEVWNIFQGEDHTASVLVGLISIAALAAILLVTGFKLASPKLFVAMWRGGRYQFIPFLVTVLAIIFQTC